MSMAERIKRGRLAIRLARQDGFDTSDWEKHLAKIFNTAGRKPGTDEGFEPWALWEWRRVSIPQWRNVLGESISQDDGKREDYARWMLSEVLLDPEYSGDPI